jgi:hypothetical protein
MTGESALQLYYRPSRIGFNQDGGFWYNIREEEPLLRRNRPSMPVAY